MLPKPQRPMNPPQQPDSGASFALSEADIDRFATLFSPATPPATPTRVAAELPSLTSHPTGRPRKSTQSSVDSDFGAFVSVPPSQDPLSDAPGSDRLGGTVSQSYVSPPTHANYHSLEFFDQFTASAKTASERNKREVLDELLRHQDDPMYFLNAHSTATATAINPSPSPSPSLGLGLDPLLTASSPSTFSPAPISISVPMFADDALAEALASEITNAKLIRVERGGSVKVALSPSRSRLPLAPHLSESGSPPSVSPLTGSNTSLPACPSPPPSASTSTQPAHATLSRISSSLVSLLPSTRPRSTTPTISFSSAPSNKTRSRATTLTHGSPFASTPYIPPTGAPGFAGDRAWDRGFSEALEHEEKRGLVDPIGLGTTAHMHHSKGKGVTLVGRREGTVRVLTEDMADLIRLQLPALIKLQRHWTLLYSLDQHGISLNTLYTRCEPRVPSRAHPNPPQGGLLVIRDADDAVFGAWLSEGIRLEKGGYYGSGESFLWRYNPEGEHEGRLDVYKWTGANAYVALCEPGFISFGGGDGHYGLYLDASLLDGSSARCPTFGNPPLCASPRGNGDGVARAKGEVAFECVGLEVWGIGPG